MKKIIKLRLFGRWRNGEFFCAHKFNEKFYVLFSALQVFLKIRHTKRTKFHTSKAKPCPPLPASESYKHQNPKRHSKMKHQVLNLKVAFCAILFMCSSLSQSINVNSKHAAHINKKSHSNGLALLPDADLTIDQEDDDDEEEEDRSETSDYSNEYDQGSSGLDLFGHPDEFDRNNALPFFHKVPENAYIMKNRQAVLKCKATNALDVSFKGEQKGLRERLSQLGGIFGAPCVGFAPASPLGHPTLMSSQQQWQFPSPLSLYYYMWRKQTWIIINFRFFLFSSRHSSHEITHRSNQQLVFQCLNDTKTNPPTTKESHVNPQSGMRTLEATAEISLAYFEQFFVSPFHCECIARNSGGEVKSRPATIVLARKSFSRRETENTCWTKT